MNRILCIISACVFATTLACASNPFASMSRSMAKSDRKAVLEKDYGNDYATIEYVLNKDMLAFDKLAAISSATDSDAILADLKKDYETDYGTILYVYEKQMAAKKRLQTE